MKITVSCSPIIKWSSAVEVYMHFGCLWGWGQFCSRELELMTPSSIHRLWAASSLRGVIFIYTTVFNYKLHFHSSVTLTLDLFLIYVFVSASTNSFSPHTTRKIYKLENYVAFDITSFFTPASLSLLTSAKNIPCKKNKTKPNLLLSSGACIQANGLDGGGQPSASLCKRSHLPYQLHLRQQWLRDLPVCRRPAH